MLKIKNLEYQPLVLDLGNESIRLNAREEKELDDKLLYHPSLEVNKDSIRIQRVAKPKIKQKKTEVKKEEKTNK